MEFELGLKLVRDADEFSSADFMLSKDRGGPLFISTESETMFFLSAHLKGYRKHNIKIEINEDGTRIIINGEKFIQETIMVGWNLQKKEMVKREFNKAFKIPEGVILDKIKAKFDDVESLLTISIPKKEKGIRGLRIEEVKEHEPISRQNSETLQIVPDDKVDEFLESEDDLQQKHPEKEAEDAEEPALLEEKPAQQHEEEAENTEKPALLEEKPAEQPEESASNAANSEETDTIQELRNYPSEEAPIVDTQQHKVFEDADTTEKKPIEQIPEAEMEGEHDECPHSEHEISQDPNQNGQNNVHEDEAEESEPSKPTHKAHQKRGRCKLCTPVIVGSSLLLSIVAFVIHFIRTKNQQGKKKD